MKNIGYKKKESQRPTATIGSEKRFDWQVENKWKTKSKTCTHVCKYFIRFFFPKANLTKFYVNPNSNLVVKTK